MKMAAENMATYFESGVGKAILHVTSDNSVELGRPAASEALYQIKRYQLVNNRVSNDAIALAFIETEILFGLGRSHGFIPTKRRVLATRASDQTVHEFDNRPAAEVYAEMLGIPANRIREELPAPPSPLNTFPFGSTECSHFWAMHSRMNREES